MEKTPDQITSPLIYEYHDPEKQQNAAGQNLGQRPDYVPNVDTIPKPLAVQMITKAVLKMINEAGSKYEGGHNAKGLRHGQGKCTYRDGSFYEGIWVEDKREGQGKFKDIDGVQYEGSWLNDLRHGLGTTQLVGSTQSLTCPYYMDKKHGYGYRTNGKNKTECIFYYDTEVVTEDQNPDYFLWAPANLLMLIIAVFFAFMAEWCYESGFLYIFAAIFYVGAIAESFLNTEKYFKNQISAAQIDSYINSSRDKAPELTMHVQNYHLNNKGKRVCSDEFSEKLAYSEYLDLSPLPETIGYIKQVGMSRLDFNIDLEFSVPATQSKEWQEQDFKLRNNKDTHQEYTLKKNFENYKEGAVVYNGDAPLYANRLVHFVFSIFTFSWLIRVIFVFRSQKVKYNFKKYIAK
ncbi:UNKNOWN [Stylonychia lemnae]|uniref:Morn repeat protein n=1 Tax=Stylonychia lemnae TaxID=5949 RepID=A0A077ZYX5_STYLE|nr:UNKNOWN [Stylonychia lemnae]|eukprot:CDW74363.1 UNKNOWN [Stylonychia lemnae]